MYVTVTRTIEHYDETSHEYASVEELKKMIADGKKPSYDNTSLGQLVDSLEDAKILMLAAEINSKKYGNPQDRIVTKTIYKLEEVA